MKFYGYDGTGSRKFIEVNVKDIIKISKELLSQFYENQKEKKFTALVD
jgi:hypothetical protein